MPSMVLELQADCMNSGTDVASLLRKALVVATKLGLADFRSWCQSEIKGYDDVESIPPYRTIHGQIKVHNPYHGWQPVLFEDSDTQRLLSERKLGQPIAQIADVLKAKSPKGLLQMPFPPEILNRFFDRHYLELGLVPQIIVNPSEIVGILDAVRNAILEWTLNLEKDGILGEQMTFTTQEKEKAMGNPNIRIDNFQGILGNVTHSSVSQDLEMTIRKGDAGSLCSFLGSKGIDESDLAALRAALEKDPKPKDAGTFGAKVSDWIARMVGKAASGAWAISVGAAGSLLATAIAKFYGL